MSELVAFKAKHGHCNVPKTPCSEYKALGQWCNAMRVSYKKKQEGKTPRRTLSQDQIARLEALGFEWVRNTTVFEKRLAELAAFKAKHGHCNVPSTPSNDYYSLGQWCCNMRGCYKQIHEGKTPHRPLSKDQIGRIEALGFEWCRKFTFEERLAELAEFKAKHGHANARKTPSSEYHSLGQWCGQMRVCYKQIQEGKTPRYPISKDQIGRFVALGLK